MAIVNNISPRFITDEGGAEVVIIGSGFTGASKVYFESVNFQKNDAKNFTVVSDEQIKAVAPSLSYTGRSWITVVVNGVNSTVPTVHAIDRDGSGGINHSSRPGNANIISISTSKPDDSRYYEVYKEITEPPEMDPLD